MITQPGYAIHTLDMCVYRTAEKEAVETEQQYYEIDDAEIDTYPNSYDVREETGFQYFGTGTFVEVTGLVPDEQTILARQLHELEQESEFPSVKYFCTPSCVNVRVERQRSTGLSYFGGIDYRSVRYFCPGPCEHMPPEPERDTGVRTFIGSVYDDEVYRVHPVPEFGNLCDIRVISGCHYYSGSRCAEKIPTEDVGDPLLQVRYFCPGSCTELPPEQPRDTGLYYFSKRPHEVTSTDALAQVDIEDEADEYPTVKYFCTPSCEDVSFEIPRETGRRYFEPKTMTTTKSVALAPTRPDVVQPGRYFVAVPTDRVPVERPRETGEREFGGPDETLLGYDGNLSDTRTETGCVYYSGEPCIDVVTVDKTVKPPPPEKYFFPGVSYRIKPETPRETGMMYFGPAPGATPSSSVAESLADDLERADTEQYAFNLELVRAKTSYWYFSGKKMHEGYPPVRYFCPGSCESLAPEPVRLSGSDYFGSDAVARISSRVGFEANLSDTRVETGCRYFGPGPCVEVQGWDRVPRCLSWTCRQVAGWIESLGFTLYRVRISALYL